MADTGKCEIPRCRNKSDHIYYGHGLCQRCLERYDSDMLKQKLNIPLSISKEVQLSKQEEQVVEVSSGTQRLLDLLNNNG